MTEENQRILDEAINIAASHLIAAMKTTGVKSSVQANVLDPESKIVYTMQINVSGTADVEIPNQNCKKV